MGLVDELLKGRGCKRVDDPGEGWGGREVYVRRVSAAALHLADGLSQFAQIPIVVKDAACDSEGRPLFKDSDNVALLDPDMLTNVFNAAIEFSGLGDTKDAEGKSESAPS